METPWVVFLLRSGVNGVEIIANTEVIDMSNGTTLSSSIELNIESDSSGPEVLFENCGLENFM